MLNAVGCVTKQAVGLCQVTLQITSHAVEINILPNTQRTSDSQPDFRVETKNIEIGVGWSKKGEASGKEYVSLSTAAPEFGPKKLYANLGRAA